MLKIIMNAEEERELSKRGLRYNCTDVGNSDRFVDQAGGETRYLLEHKKWIKWNGSRWEIMDGGILSKAMEVARTIYDEARDCQGSGQRELSLWAARSQKKPMLDSMLALSQDRLAVSCADFDADETVVNCRNGIVDLKTGELLPHNAEQKVLKMADANYLPKSECPRWLRFLSEIFLDDSELIAFLKRALGYSLTGMTRDSHIFLAYGLGANGKTKLFETVRTILGDYARPTEFSTFLNSDKNGLRGKEAVGQLQGIRFAIAAETDGTTRWNEALIKKLTGGDMLTGARLYGSSYDFKPTHKLWFMANHLPGVKDASHSFWRRPIVIPFQVRFTAENRDADLGEKLLAERDGIFKWLVEGATEYIRDGLGDLPKVCQEAHDRYRNDNDVLSRFVHECLVNDAGNSIKSEEAHDLYVEWCVRNGEDPASIRYFSKNMEERGIEKRKSRAANVFVGYRKRGPVELEIVADNDNSSSRDKRAFDECREIEAKAWNAERRRLETEDEEDTKPWCLKASN